MTGAPRKLRLLYLSSLPARNTTSGALLIHRHLTQASDRFEVFHAHDDSGLPEDAHHLRVPVRPWFLRLQSTRWFKHVWSLNYGLGASVAPGTLDRLCEQVRPDVIVTVSEGGLMAPTRRVAQRRRLPLVTFHHDWASDWLPAPEWIKRLADRQLRALYRASRVNLCVSRNLRRALGPHPDAWFLPPIPEPKPAPTDPHADAAGFQVVYTGVLHNLYREEIEGLARALHRVNATATFRAYGPQPPAGGPLVDGPDEMRAIYGGFLKGEAFERILTRASALLVISPFGAAWQKIARYSFPSKIPEYCRFGKPVIVWGPAGSTSVDWATESGAALVVTDPSPAALVAAVDGLRNDPARIAQLSARATAAARGQFHPARLQSLFESALAFACGLGPRPPANEID